MDVMASLPRQGHRQRPAGGHHKNEVIHTYPNLHFQTFCFNLSKTIGLLYFVFGNLLSRSCSIQQDGSGKSWPHNPKSTTQGAQGFSWLPHCLKLPLTWPKADYEQLPSTFLCQHKRCKDMSVGLNLCCVTQGLHQVTSDFVNSVINGHILKNIRQPFIRQVIQNKFPITIISWKNKNCALNRIKVGFTEIRQNWQNWHISLML
jgi:hypothetical protein